MSLVFYLCRAQGREEGSSAATATTKARDGTFKRAESLDYRDITQLGRDVSC